MAKEPAKAEPAAESAATAAPAAMTWPLEYKFAKPATAFGEDYRSLSLREPSAADCLKFGIFDDEVDGDQLLNLIAHLSGLTPATVRALPGVDMLRLSRKLMQVFHQAAQ
jgi:hypothetical protein